MRISAIVDNKEKRTAIVPETVKKYIELGFEVILPKGIGINAGFSDAEYLAAGASIEKKTAEADLYLCVKPSFEKEIKLKAGSYLIALLSNLQNSKMLENMKKNGVKVCALEKIPRITRAQHMDVLSSQASIAGYRAVIEGLFEYCRIAPLMMTAAGTIRPAKVLVLGAGIAGLQAIATAKRLGAAVSAFDVRIAAKEQVESLGANFIELDNNDDGEASSGYAKEMGKDYKMRQEKKLLEIIHKIDIAITTAQIPGKPAPKLITKAMVESMQPGAVIVDMSTETGGNCELSKKDEVIKVGEITIIGHTNLAARVAYDASKLFSRNVFNFVSLMIKNGKINTEDEIIQSIIL